VLTVLLALSNIPVKENLGNVRLTLLILEKVFKLLAILGTLKGTEFAKFENREFLNIIYHHYIICLLSIFSEF
jgi:hypothetical protein